ncbi:MAG: ABC transporter permease subunit [Ilumatobacteraceae bacterium]
MLTAVDTTTARAVRPARPRRSGSGVSRALKAAIGIAAYLVLWELAGRRGWLGTTFPPLSDVAEKIVGDAQRAVIMRALSSTASASLAGFVVGVTAALAGSILALVVPPLRAGIDQLATILHAMPVIALAPLFIVTLGRERTPTAIAALAAGFAMFVAATAAVESARPLQQDLFTALGSGRLRRFASLELPAAIPGLADGLRLAAPAAILGAVLGEWFGAPRGLGVLIVSAMQNYQIELLWAAALLAAFMSMIAFGLFTLLSRWAAKRWAV